MGISNALKVDLPLKFCDPPTKSPTKIKNSDPPNKYFSEIFNAGGGGGGGGGGGCMPWEVQRSRLVKVQEDYLVLQGQVLQKIYVEEHQ